MRSSHSRNGDANAGRRKRKNNNENGDEPRSLAAKVSQSGEDACFGLEEPSYGNDDGENYQYGSKNKTQEDPNDSGRSHSRYSIPVRGTPRTPSSSTAAPRIAAASRSTSGTPSRPSSTSTAAGHRRFTNATSHSRRAIVSSSASRASSSKKKPRSSASRRHHQTPTRQSNQGTTPTVPAVHIVCAIGENLARESCISSLDAGSPVALQVTKQSNGQTYAETIAYMKMLQPDEVLLNEGRRNSPLATKILQLYGMDQDTNAPFVSGQQQQQQQPNHQDPQSLDRPPPTSTVVKFISRAYFDQTKGAELLQKIARTETFDPTLLDEYILLSSAHAVLHYTQVSLGASYSRNSLHISVNSGGKNRMAIDRSTLLQLELLTNAKTGKTQDSLFASIDSTKTTVGSRLLRTSIMAPPCRADTINTRLDLVDMFLSSEDFFFEVLEHLRGLPPIDKMLSSVAMTPRQSQQLRKQGSNKNDAAAAVPVVTRRMASKGISALVCVKSTLSAIPSLAQALQDHLADIDQQVSQRHPSTGGGEEDESDQVTLSTSRSSLLVGLGGSPVVAAAIAKQSFPLLRAILFTITQPQLNEIKEAVASIFTDSTSYSRNANAMRHQECFALRSADDGMMDVLRKAFLANVDDIYKKADEYAELHGIHVSVRFSVSRGYYLTVPVDMAPDLPLVFIQPTKVGRYIHCTTEEVHSLNIRAEDNVQDLLLMTYERIQGVLDIAREKYDALASLSDAIALLDLCHSFADTVTLSKSPWCRPTVHGTLDESKQSSPSNDENNAANNLTIRNGRYAVDVADSFLSSADGPREIIPNDTYVSNRANFVVLSGINGSGKSTYLKQVAIIVVLAHCGGYVPAEYASVPLRNRLCVRMGSSDDQENNISSFMLEMKETAFICSNATAGSLILMDELGRATSNEDGVAIAWAVSEYLIAKNAMTFFVTHYPHLCRLERLYPCVQNQHLSASLSENGIRYTHKLTKGADTTTQDYGVEMAASCGWPLDVVNTARSIEASIQEHFPQNRAEQNSKEVSDHAGLQSMAKVTAKQLAEVAKSESTLEGLQASLEVIRQELLGKAAAAGIEPASEVGLRMGFQKLKPDQDSHSDQTSDPQILEQPMVGNKDSSSPGHTEESQMAEPTVVARVSPGN